MDIKLDGNKIIETTKTVTYLDEILNRKKELEDKIAEISIEQDFITMVVPNERKFQLNDFIEELQRINNVLNSVNID